MSAAPKRVSVQDSFQAARTLAAAEMALAVLAPDLLRLLATVTPPPPPGGRRCLHARAAGEVECGARSNFVGVEKYSSGNFLTAELEMTAAAGRSRARACTDSIDGMPRQLLEFFAWGESH